MKRLLMAIAMMVAAAMTSVAASAQEGLVGVTRAVGVAERSLGAHAIEAQLETKDGVLVYQIGLVRAGRFHKVLVHARSAQLIGVDEPRIEGLYRRWFDNVRLSAAQRPLAPILAALEASAHGHVHKVGLKLKNGRALYEVEIETGNGVAEIELDAVTGRRVSLTPDN